LACIGGIAAQAGLVMPGSGNHNNMLFRLSQHGEHSESPQHESGHVDWCVSLQSCQ
jgi:hypothetical protein